MRNLGGSVGISMCTTMLDRRSQFHLNRLVDHLTPYDTQYRQAVHNATQTMTRGGASPGVAMRRALQSIYQTVQNQAAMISYTEIFKALAVAALVMIVMVYFLRNMNPGESAHGAA
jgi:DHA2 family multidrug resistance protein